MKGAVSPVLKSEDSEAYENKLLSLPKHFYSTINYAREESFSHHAIMIKNSVDII